MSGSYTHNNIIHPEERTHPLRRNPSEIAFPKSGRKHDGVSQGAAASAARPLKHDSTDDGTDFIELGEDRTSSEYRGKVLAEMRKDLAISKEWDRRYRLACIESKRYDDACIKRNLDKAVASAKAEADAKSASDKAEAKANFDDAMETLMQFRNQRDPSHNISLIPHSSDHHSAEDSLLDGLDDDEFLGEKPKDQAARYETIDILNSLRYDGFGGDLHEKLVELVKINTEIAYKAEKERRKATKQLVYYENEKRKREKETKTNHVARHGSKHGGMSPRVDMEEAPKRRERKPTQFYEPPDNVERDHGPY